MITSTDQLKAKIRNISKGNSDIAKNYMRVFFMERFLERVAISEYRDQFILKGGMLAASLLGVDMRSTMDIDTTVHALPLTIKDISSIINKICSIELDDNVSFEIKSVDTIMDEFDYPGVRFHLDGYMNRIKQPIKIDISTDDEITPEAIKYEYSLMFEERTIKILSYNIETLLAEKVQTVLNRGIANTRMRDFFDIYEISRATKFSREILKQAFSATCKKRETIFHDSDISSVLDKIRNSKEMQTMWNRFVQKNTYAATLNWERVVEYVCEFIEIIAIGSQVNSDVK